MGRDRVRGASDRGVDVDAADRIRAPRHRAAPGAGGEAGAVAVTSFRRNRITGDPIVFAPERAARPRAFLDSSSEGRCPFCRGHEADTPPEIARAGDPWRARVVPNKYPSIPGAEVIIEAP